MIAHVLFMVASTVAAARFNGLNRQATCSAEMVCTSVDRLITPLHAIFPLSVTLVGFLLVNIPLGTMPSPMKVRRLKRATCQLLLLSPTLGLLWYAFAVSPTLVTMISSHMGVFLLANYEESATLYEKCICLSHLGIILAWTMQEGPPIPVLDSPGLNVCCGYMAHLAGIVVCSLLIPTFNRLLSRLVVGTP